MEKLLLASKSPRRISILREIGIDAEVCAADIDEGAVSSGCPAALARELAARKAAHVAEMRGNASRYVIAADTLVELDGEKLGKPADEKEAYDMLRRLSGSCHMVHTGTAVAHMGRCEAVVETTKVWFRDTDDDEIRRYIASGEPMDKAGAYGIQEMGRLFVSRIEGDYFNVMGLPVCRLELLLRERFSVSLYDFASGI